MADHMPQDRSSRCHSRLLPRRPTSSTRNKHACSTALRDASARLKQLREAKPERMHAFISRRNPTPRSGLRSKQGKIDGDSDDGSIPCSGTTALEDTISNLSRRSGESLGDSLGGSSNSSRRHIGSAPDSDLDFAMVERPGPRGYASPADDVHHHRYVTSI